MGAIGLGLYFLLQPHLDSVRELAGGISNLDDILFIFFLCLSFAFLNQSVYYRDLGFFVSLSAAFVVLIRRTAFWSSEALEKRRGINVLEGYVLGAYVILSPYYLNFVPRWWDIYYAYSVFHDALTAGGFNVLQTYHGFPLFYSFNSLLVSVSFGPENELLYIITNGLFEATVMIGVYMLSRKLLGERAAQTALIVMSASVLYVAYVITALDFSIVLSFFVLFLMVTRGRDKKSVMIGMGLIGMSALLYHPTGAIAIDFSLLLLLLVEFLARQRIISLGVVLIYSAISISYTLFVAGSSFEFLIAGLTSHTTNPYTGFSTGFASSVQQFSYYWFVNYLSLTIAFIFGAYFIAYALMQRRDRPYIFMALFPIGFVFVSLSQLATGLGSAETTLDSFITVAVVFAVGGALTLLSKRKSLALLFIGLLSLMFFMAIIVPGDNLYFGKGTYSNQVPTFGTNQQESAITIFDQLPPGSVAYSDSIIFSWAVYRLGLIGIQVPSVSSVSLAASPYNQSSYLIYSSTAFSRYAVGGDPSLVYENVSRASGSNDIVYASGDVSGVFIR
jgi:hypothetical protein